jgi:TolB-like protein/Flp pilus assembly protein TadD
MRHTMDAVPGLAAARPAVTAELEQTIATALAKTTADRFSSVATFAEALTRAPANTNSGSATVLRSGRNLRRSAALIAAILGAIVVALLVLRPGGGGPRADAGLRTAIAVLPFENLSTNAEHAYFAGGLHDELLTQLSKVAALKVISRTSVMGYADHKASLKQIAGELGVGSIVEGSVQVVGNRLRVNVQLIDAATDAHLWAERYDRTLDDAFAIQSDIARQVVAQVGAALSGSEQQGIAMLPTSNAEAYRFYLQGREYFNRASRLRQDYETAEQLYQRAVDLDSTFALAYVALADVHSLMYVIRYDPSPARVARARLAAETALRLAPDLPQAQVAISWVYGWGNGDFGKALDALEVAVRGLPNDARLWERVGFTHRRLGNWNESVAAFDKATQLDPRDADPFHHGGVTFDLLHRYPESIRNQDIALRLAPDFHAAKVWKGWAYARSQGQLDSLRAYLSEIPDGAPLGPAGDATGQRAALLWWERKADSLLALVQRSPQAAFEGELFFHPAALYAAWGYRLRGETAAARKAFARAESVTDSMLQRFPDDWRAHAARGMALAGLGRKSEALAEVRWLEQSRLSTGDSYFSPLLAEFRAGIMAQVGDASGAAA